MRTSRPPPCDLSAARWARPQVLGWFQYRTAHEAGGGPGARLSICRIKNKFSLPKSEVVGGYRDLTVCVVYEGPGGLRIIGEIQVLDGQYRSYIA